MPRNGEITRRFSPLEQHKLMELDRAARSQAKAKSQRKQDRLAVKAFDLPKTGIGRVRYALGIVILSLAAAIILWVVR